MRFLNHRETSRFSGWMPVGSKKLGTLSVQFTAQAPQELGCGRQLIALFRTHPDVEMVAKLAQSA